VSFGLHVGANGNKEQWFVLELPACHAIPIHSENNPRHRFVTLTGISTIQQLSH